MAPRVAANHHAVLPIALEDLGCDAGRRRMGVGSEVADAAVDVQLTVGCQPHESVVAATSRGMECLTDSDSRDLRAPPPAAPRPPLGPVERLCAAIEHLTLVRARDRPLRAVEFPVVVGRVDAAKLNRVDAERAGRLVEKRLHRHRDLVLSRTALRTGRRRVAADGDSPVTHRDGLVQKRHGSGCRAQVAAATVGPILLHDVEIRGREPSFGAEAHPDPPLKRGP